jgi:hypothetical protein
MADLSLLGDSGVQLQVNMADLNLLRHPGGECLVRMSEARLLGDPDGQLWVHPSSKTILGWKPDCGRIGLGADLQGTAPRPHSLHSACRKISKLKSFFTTSPLYYIISNSVKMDIKVSFSVEIKSVYFPST